MYQLEIIIQLAISRLKNKIKLQHRKKKKNLMANFGRLRLCEFNEKSQRKIDLTKIK